VVIEWSPRARQNLESIIARISIDSPRGAKRIADRITKRVEDLKQFPEQGVARPGRIYRLDVAHTPYFVVYRVSEKGVTILSVLHGRRNRRS
jgi:plasmid stabilization system protein ParE